MISGVLNSLDRFAAAAAAPVFFNLLLMAALVGLTPYLPTPGHALAWGVFAAGVVQLAMVWVAARQAGMALRLYRRPALTPPIRQVLRRMVPGVLGAGVTQINLAVDVIIASFLVSGSVSYLYYADRVAQLPLGVIGAALGTALLPLLSRIALAVAIAVTVAVAIAIDVAFAVAITFTIAVTVAFTVAITIAITLAIAVAVAVAITIAAALTLAVAVTFAIAYAVPVTMPLLLLLPSPSP
jgi:putative peptidoglycan lipid II flippase